MWETTDLHEDVYRNSPDICIQPNTFLKLVWIDMILNFFSEADTFLFPENGGWMCLLAVQEKLCFEAAFLTVVMSHHFECIRFPIIH